MLEVAQRLEARERLARIVDGQVSSGLVKRHDQHRHIGALKRQARGERGVLDSRERSVDSTLFELERMGITVEDRRKKAEGGDG